MDKNIKFSIAAIVVIILGIFIYYQSRPADIDAPIDVVQEENVEGCYVATLSKDVYTLTILSQEEDNFDGKLSFKNFQKDSSSGTFNGTYKNGILLGNYSFQSEGMDSVMQVIFKKVGNDFIRGYGEVDNATGTRFTDLNNITYDAKVVFKGEVCAD